MNTPTICEKARGGIRALLVLLFLGVLWLPSLDALFHWDATPPANENRRFATFPEFAGFKSSKAFIAGLEAFFNDHFGFRKLLVTWNNEWKHALFHEAPFSSVMNGRNGWLFLASYQMTEHYTGLSRWTPEDLIDWQRLLEARRDWLEPFGVKYIYVVPPDKHSVYPEHLPEWLKQGPLPSKLDQFIAHMKAHSTVEVLDLRASLLAAKSNGLVYPLTDTHWNAYGGFIASQEIIKALKRQIPGLQPMSLDDFERKPLPDRQGDLARLAGQLQPEAGQFAIVPRPPVAPLRQITGKSKLLEPWHDPQTLITLCDDAHGKAIVFRDSFGDNLIPFLGFYFHEVVYRFRRDLDADMLRREKPVVVIDEELERMFNLRNPRLSLEAFKAEIKAGKETTR